MDVGSFQTGVCMWVEILVRCMHMGSFQTGVCMWVQISDRCMHVGRDFRQVYAYG